MTRVRRRVRRPVPKGLAEISRLELVAWAMSGPLVAGPYGDEVVRNLERAGYIVWESWDEWAQFYGQVRERWRDERSNTPERRPEAAERLYQAIVAGLDPVLVRRQIHAEAAANDPRDWLDRYQQER